MVSSICGCFAPSSSVESLVSPLSPHCSDARNAYARSSQGSASLFERSKMRWAHPCGPSHSSASFHETRKLFCVQVKAAEERGAEVPEPSQAQSSARLQLDLLEKLKSGTEKGLSMRDPENSTVAEQLATKLPGGNPDASVILGKKIPQEYSDLTVSQKRNIRRQQYMDQVNQRNDAPFFATVALFVILPPVIILGVAVATGYVDLLP